MEFLFWFVVEPVLWLLADVFVEDERPSARRITVGCGVVVLLAALVAGFIFLR